MSIDWDRRSRNFGRHKHLPEDVLNESTGEPEVGGETFNGGEVTEALEVVVNEQGVELAALRVQTPEGYTAPALSVLVDRDGPTQVFGIDPDGTISAGAFENESEWWSNRQDDAEPTVSISPNQFSEPQLTVRGHESNPTGPVLHVLDGEGDLAFEIDGAGKVAGRGPIIVERSGLDPGEQIFKLTAPDDQATAVVQITNDSGTASFTISSDGHVVTNPRPGATHIASFFDDQGNLVLRVFNDGTITAPGLPGAILHVSQVPHSATPYTTSDTNVADIDATNLAPTVTVPPSGNLLVRLDFAGAAGQVVDGQIVVRNAANGLLARMYAPQSTVVANVSAALYITGQTPGASLQLKIGWSVGSGSWTMYRSTAQYGGGPITLTVMAA